jgi:peptidoglycan/LPS O-acetylase OafA/YrhL
MPSVYGIEPIVTITPLRAPTPEDKGQNPSSGPDAGRRGHIGWVVAGSLVSGFVAAVILPFLPVGTVDVNFSTAMVLFGWALGWALLAGLSTRFTDQPQRWAVTPAIFMAVAGVLVLVVPDSFVDAMGWSWWCGFGSAPNATCTAGPGCGC